MILFKYQAGEEKFGLEESRQKAGERRRNPWPFGFLIRNLQKIQKIQKINTLKADKIEVEQRIEK